MLRLYRLLPGSKPAVPTGLHLLQWMGNLPPVPFWNSEHYCPMEITFFYNRFLQVKNDFKANIYGQHSQRSNKHQPHNQCHSWHHRGFQVKRVFYTCSNSASSCTSTSLLHGNLWLRVDTNPFWWIFVSWVHFLWNRIIGFQVPPCLPMININLQQNDWSPSSTRVVLLISITHPNTMMEILLSKKSAKKKKKSYDLKFHIQRQRIYILTFIAYMRYFNRGYQIQQMTAWPFRDLEKRD